MAGPEDVNGWSRDQASPRSGDTLAYLCDIIVELKQIADRSGQRTLSAILSAALTEARIQNENHTRR